MTWTAARALDLYNIPHWGEGYFDVADNGPAKGHVLVRPFRERSPVAIDLYELAQRLPKEGLQLPVLLRFN
ncbi:MAG: arginine decarboxylase, partial [Stenotrophobium sp.]